MAICLNGKKYVDEKMPKIGLGTYEIRTEKEIFDVLDAALEVGYRFIDTAQVYKNEKFIGNSLRTLLPKYNLKREDIFITSKLGPANQGTEKCQKAIEKSLKDFQIEYLDLLLIHWPGTSKLDPNNQLNKSSRMQSWQCMENFYKSGKLKSIGVSNYNICHLKELLANCSVLPAVNQCECHPHYPNTELIEFCQKNNIHFQAYSSFGSESNKDRLLADSQIIEMANKYDCSVTDFLLAWGLCQNLSVLPRSRNPQHVKENFAAKVLIIKSEDIEVVKSKIPKKYCWDPAKIC